MRIDHWVGGWAADPTGALGQGYANQTLRIMLTPHIGGSRLRVHISNRYGSAPLRVARASVALRQTGPASSPPRAGCCCSPGRAP